MEKWLREANDSLLIALEIATRGDVDLQNLYMLAPVVYSIKQNMNNEAMIDEMNDLVEEQVAEDCAHDANSILQHRFHYVYSYISCFVVAGKLDEMKFDRIMEYINKNMTLFITE